MKKVLRITNTLDFGGIEKVFELHGKYFNKLDYELVFVAMNGSGYTSELLKSWGYRVIILRTNIRIPSITCLVALYRLFRKERPHVIHACGAEANFHAIIAGKVARVPTCIAEEIGLPDHSFVARNVFKMVYAFSSKVIAISNAVYDYLVSYEVEKTKAVRIYNPIDTRRISILPSLSENEVVISCLCRLEPVKNCKVLIRLIAHLCEKHGEKHFTLWLIGDGSERKMLEDQSKELGVSNNVIFWGFQKDPYKLMAASNVFVLPSLKEGFGLACIEAIQCSVPVVVSRSGGMREFITDGYNGFLFDPLSFEELVDKTERALGLWGVERVNFVERARQTIEDLFSPMKYLEELKGLYFSDEY